MATLNSASSLDDVQASYADSASYHEDGSPAKARAFITACRLLLLLLPKRASRGGRAQGEEIELDPRLLAEQITEAKRFLSESADRTVPPNTFSFQSFRD